jgi:hypothetical protein
MPTISSSRINPVDTPWTALAVQGGEPVVAAGKNQRGIVLPHLDSRRHGYRKLSLRAFHNQLFADLHLHALG